MPAKPKYKSDHGKQSEVTAATLLRLASSHKWFAKDHWRWSKKESDLGVSLMHQAIATMHEENASILRVEAQKIRDKP